MSRSFQIKTVPSSWIEKQGRRLDCGPYVSGAMEAKELLRQLKARKDHLQDLTEGGISGIINAGRITRQWVEDAEHGYPFLSSTDILQADISNISHIAKSVARQNSQLLIKERWTLITRSGSIGKMAYARADMDGMACTEDVLRVIPDEDKVKPGYIYAYLCSKFGLPLVISGTYGSIITHLEPHHIADLPVPRLGAVEEQAHILIKKAADSRVEAAKIITMTSEKAESKFDLWDESFSDKARIARNGFTTSSTALANSGRFEATYHDAIAAEIADRIQSQHHRRLDSVCTVKKPGMFKRIVVDGPEYGYGFVPGSELFTLAPKPAYWVSPKTPNIEDCVLSPYWILMQAFGQLGGLIGRCMMTTPFLDGCTATDLQIQLRFDNKFDAGYVFAVLYSRPGYKLISRTPIGGSIPHIHPKDIESMHIPWPDEGTRHAIGERIVEAWDKREEAIRLEDQARALVERAIEEGGR